MAKSTNTQFAVAVHVLTYLAAGTAAGRTDPVGSEELAASAAVNPVHIRKVLGPLRESGLVSSRAGARGGWELAADPKNVALSQVWALLREDTSVLGIHGPNPKCEVGGNIVGVLADVDARIADTIRAELGEISLSDVLDQAGFDPRDYFALAGCESAGV